MSSVNEEEERVRLGEEEAAVRVEWKGEVEIEVDEVLSASINKDDRTTFSSSVREI